MKLDALVYRILSFIGRAELDLLRGILSLGTQPWGQRRPGE
jgi:hypothetical protein